MDKYEVFGRMDKWMNFEWIEGWVNRGKEKGGREEKDGRDGEWEGGMEERREGGKEERMEGGREERMEGGKEGEGREKGKRRKGEG